MQSISTIGLDIAKSVFQVHGVDTTGQLVLRRQLRRRYVLAFFQKLPPLKNLSGNVCACHRRKVRIRRAPCCVTLGNSRSVSGDADRGFGRVGAAAALVAR